MTTLKILTWACIHRPIGKAVTCAELPHEFYCPVGLSRMPEVILCIKVSETLHHEKEPASINDFYCLHNSKRPTTRVQCMLFSITCITVRGQLHVYNVCYFPSRALLFCYSTSVLLNDTLSCITVNIYNFDYKYQVLNVVSHKSCENFTDYTQLCQLHWQNGQLQILTTHKVSNM